MIKLMILSSMLMIGHQEQSQMTVSGRAPFCKVDNAGMLASCYYYSMSSCMSNVKGTSSFCIINPNQ